MMRLNRGAAAPALAAVAAPLPLLLLALLLPLASAQFTQITSTFLAGTCNVDDGFGAEDKMAICNGDLVFIDLDPDVSNVWRYRYQPAANVWSKDPLVALPCPDSGEGGLVPRETGYVIGQTKGPFGGDRLLVLGGAASGSLDDENNVYFSDDCGRTWSCYDGEQVWQPRDFAAVALPSGVLPYDPTVMAGGLVEAGPGDYEFSIAFLLSYDGGVSWQRPECGSIDDCRYKLPVPDTFGRCLALDGGNYYQHCFMLPEAPLTSGAMAADWTTLYAWYEPEDTDDDANLGRVYYLNASNFNSGWSQLPGAHYGGMDGGRKVGYRATGPVDRPPAHALSLTSRLAAPTFPPTSLLHRSSCAARCPAAAASSIRTTMPRSFGSSPTITSSARASSR